MKQIIRILISLMIASTFVYTYYDNKFEAPEKISNSINDFTLESTSIPTAQEDTLLTIEVLINGPLDSTLNFQFRSSRSLQNENTLLRLYARTPLTRPDSSGQAFSTRVQSPKKGAATYYYFEILDPIGRYKAGLKMTDDRPFKIRGVGKIPGWITYSQLALLFLAMFSIALATMLASECKDNYARTAESVKWFMASLVCLIPGVYLFETISRMHLLGESWQAVPFGTDPSDNLFQILIVFIFLLILGGKTLMAKSEQKTGIISQSSYRKLATAALVISFSALVLFGRLNISASVTEVLSYSILASLFLSYTVLHFKAKNS
ncbi:MAG: hypothetical protein IIC66_00880 [candidate division Zixibacteria bacterium]|nr:hypothetical protein [candidate division Zixibacteria bacterium]